MTGHRALIAGWIGILVSVPAASGATPEDAQFELAATSTLTRGGQLETSSSSTKPEVVRRLAESQVFWSLRMTTNTLDPEQQLSPNDTVWTSVSFRPRVQLTDEWRLWAQIDLDYEFTNSDTTTRSNEAVVSDLLLQLVYRWDIPVPWSGFSANLSADLVFPTSKASQAFGRRFSIGPQVQLIQSVPEVAGGRLDFVLGSSYLRNVNETVVAEYDEGTTAPAYPLSCFGGGTSVCPVALGETFAVSDILSWRAFAIGYWGRVSPGIAFWLNHEFVETPDPVPVLDEGSATEIRVREVEDPSSVRVSSLFAMWVDVRITDWLIAELGYTLTRTNVVDDDGRIANPFFDDDEPMTVYLAVIVQPANLWPTVSAEDRKVDQREADESVIRF